MIPIIHFFNSSFFFALITLLVGFIAIAIYLRQREEEKRDSASLILQEIRFAENKLRNFNVTFGFNFHDHILPTASWHKSIHFFVNQLEENEIDLISSFYTKCEYVDILIRKIADQHFFPATLHVPPGQIAPGVAVPQNLSVAPAVQANSVPQGLPSGPQSIVSQPVVSQLAQAHLHELTLELRSGYILNSSVGEHLREISTRKKWSIF